MISYFQTLNIKKCIFDNNSNFMLTFKNTVKEDKKGKIFQIKFCFLISYTIKQIIISLSLYGNMQLL